MASYGEHIFTLTGLVVAAWDGTNYGLPQAVGDQQKLTVEPQFDTDELKAGGMVRALLSVPTHLSLTLEYARLEAAVLAVVAGESPAETGTTPNVERAFGVSGGNAGLPYFAVIGSFAAEDGGNLLLGVPLAKLDAYPAPSNDQNQFGLYSVAGRGMANSACSAPNQLIFYKQNETAASLPATAAAVDTFFGVA